MPRAGSVNAVQLQWEYLEHAKKYVEREDDTPENREVLERWEMVLGALETDPLTLHRELDWVAKHRVIQAYRDRDGLEWNDPKLRAIDLQYHDVRRDKGLYYRLEAGGKVERLTTDTEVEDAVMNPPVDTRAYFRGRCIEQVPRCDRGGLMGLAHRRHRRRCLAAHTDAGTTTRHEGTRRGTAGRVRRRGLAGREAAGLSPRPSGGRSSALGRTIRNPRVGWSHRKESCRAAGARAEEGPAQGRRRRRDRRRRRSGAVVSKAAELKEEMDDILDEIDSVLEENAEEFVKSYVQKGGE